MQAFKYWATAILGDGILAATFYAWQVHGVVGAGNLFLFVAWGISIIGLLVGMLADREDFKDTRPAGFIYYHAATEVVLVAALVWCGLQWLAGVRFVSVMLVEGARKREPKPKEGAEQ